MALFNRKKEDVPGIESPPNPAQNVNDMRQMGMSNNQIVQNMQRGGTNLGDINNAMNQSYMNPGTQGGPYPGQAQQQPPATPQQEPMAPSGAGMPPDMGAPPAMSDVAGDDSMANMQFEELAESIIEEIWNDLMKNVNKIIDWKNQMDSRFVQVEQKFGDLQHNFDELHKALIAKINEYDQNILNVGSQVKAMEKVFSKVLPTFTDTVNELGRITNYVKTDTPKASLKQQGKPKKKVEDEAPLKEDDDVDEIPHEFLNNL